MTAHTHARTLRRAVSELAQETRLKVVDRLDDPSEPWVLISTGPHKVSSDTLRYVRLTYETDHDLVDDETHRAHVELLKADIRRSLHRGRSYTG